jgi:hypothetical protein
VPVNTLHAAMRLVQRNGFERHDFAAPASQRREDDRA